MYPEGIFSSRQNSPFRILISTRQRCSQTHVHRPMSSTVILMIFLRKNNDVLIFLKKFRLIQINFLL